MILRHEQTLHNPMGFICKTWYCHMIIACSSHMTSSSCSLLLIALLGLHRVLPAWGRRLVSSCLLIKALKLLVLQEKKGCGELLVSGHYWGFFWVFSELLVFTKKFPAYLLSMMHHHGREKFIDWHMHNIPSGWVRDVDLELSGQGQKVS